MTSPTKRTVPNVADYEDACRLVDALGMMVPWAVKGCPLPSLADAWRNGPNGVPGPEWTTPVWEWKDQMPAEKRAYYGSLLRKGKLLLATRLVPAFYRAAGRTSDAEDYLIDYEEGQLSFVGKQIIDALQEEPRSIQELKATLGRQGVDLKGLTACLDELQSRFYIAKIDIVQGSSYGYVWDLVDRAWPEVVAPALAMSRGEARSEVVGAVIKAAGAISEKDLIKLVPFRPQQVQDSLKLLGQRGVVHEIKDNTYASAE